MLKYLVAVFQRIHRLLNWIIFLTTFYLQIHSTCCSVVKSDAVVPTICFFKLFDDNPGSFIFCIVVQVESVFSFPHILFLDFKDFMLGSNNLDAFILSICCRICTPEFNPSFYTRFQLRCGFTACRFNKKAFLHHIRH